uniref:Uncharacterized protein n=1 Tax=Cacopsylla melanoneura TaxID=428564 RepID=A0A8D8VN53_9HEMI
MITEVIVVAITVMYVGAPRMSSIEKGKVLAGFMLRAGMVIAQAGSMRSSVQFVFRGTEIVPASPAHFVHSCGMVCATVNVVVRRLSHGYASSTVSVPSTKIWQGHGSFVLIALCVPGLGTPCPAYTGSSWSCLSCSCMMNLSCPMYDHCHTRSV